jgi:hypothetical protein
VWLQGNISCVVSDWRWVEVSCIAVVCSSSCQTVQTVHWWLVQITSQAAAVEDKSRRGNTLFVCVFNVAVRVWRGGVVRARLCLMSSCTYEEARAM